MGAVSGQSPLPRGTIRYVPASSGGLFPTLSTLCRQRLSNELPPFTIPGAFGFPETPAYNNTGHPRFTLHCVTALHRRGFHHYYGVICHPAAHSSFLESPLGWKFPLQDATGLPRLRRVPCERCHPQTHHGADQVPGLALFCTLTLPSCRIRFAFAMYRSLPIASFRPCRCQQRPCNSDCLPPGRGDACVPQAGFARHAGQTKKATPVWSRLLYRA
jgi:hypothetical protein